MKRNVTIEMITAKRAKELLANLVDEQRKMRMSYVNVLSREILANNFRLSNDAIVIVGGKLVNGQHRLSAVAQTGRPCPFIILETEDQDIYQIIDCGIKRSMGDVYKGMGFDNVHQLAAVVRMIVAYESKSISWTRTEGRKLGDPMSGILRGDQVAYLEANHDQLLAQLHEVWGFWKRDGRPILGYTVGTTFIHLADKVHVEVRPFLFSIYDGSPVGFAKLFRQKIELDILRSRVQPRMRPETLLAYLIKAWNLESRKSTLKKLNADETGFPVLGA
jgi:hypothetical protein